jgi:hypothetical protein
VGEARPEQRPSLRERILRHACERVCTHIRISAECNTIGGWWFDPYTLTLRELCNKIVERARFDCINICMEILEKG